MATANIIGTCYCVIGHPILANLDIGLFRFRDLVLGGLPTEPGLESISGSGCDPIYIGYHPPLWNLAGRKEHSPVMAEHCDRHVHEWGHPRHAIVVELAVIINQSV